MTMALQLLKKDNIYTVKRYTASNKLDWNTFVSKAKNATFLFNRNFMDYHHDRFIDHSVIIFKNEEIYALLPANEVDGKIISHQGLTYGSFILAETGTLLYSLEAFKEMLCYYEKQGISEVEIRNIPTFYNTMPADELAYFLFLAKAEMTKRDVLMVIDTTNKLKFKKNRREGINKAIRNGLKIKTENNFKDFWNKILIPNLENKHGVKPVHTLEEIELLASRFPNAIKQVNVYKDNEIVAGTTVFLTETTIHPQYVSGNATKNAYGSLDLAYDFIINHFDKSKRYFDFNISSENNGKALNSGLLFWKESCGARAYTADTYVIKTANHTQIDLKIL